jgi:hypothetical protein
LRAGGSRFQFAGLAPGCDGFGGGLFPMALRTHA